MRRPGLVLDVTGSSTLSLPLGLTDRFTFTGVPAGSYTFAVRATNMWGTSSASHPVTLTFPGVCSGAPLPPANFVAYPAGRSVFIVWEPAAGGPAPTGYVLKVTGAFNGSFPATGRSLSGSVGPGVYNFSVTATNTCGQSPATAPQTVAIP